MQKCAGEVLKKKTNPLGLVTTFLKALFLPAVAWLWALVDPICYTRLSFLEFLQNVRKTTLLSRLLWRMTLNGSAKTWNDSQNLVEQLCNVSVECTILKDGRRTR